MRCGAVCENRPAIGRHSAMDSVASRNEGITEHGSSTPLRPQNKVLRGITVPKRDIERRG